MLVNCFRVLILTFDTKTNSKQCFGISLLSASMLSASWSDPLPLVNQPLARAVSNGPSVSPSTYSKQKLQLPRVRANPQGRYKRYPPTRVLTHMIQIQPIMHNVCPVPCRLCMFLLLLCVLDFNIATRRKKQKRRNKQQKGYVWSICDPPPPRTKAEKAMIRWATADCKDFVEFVAKLPQSADVIGRHIQRIAGPSAPGLILSRLDSNGLCRLGIVNFDEQKQILTHIKMAKAGAFGDDAGVGVSSMSQLFGRQEQRIGRKALDYGNEQKMGLRSNVEVRAAQKSKQEAFNDQEQTTGNDLQKELVKRLETATFPSFVARPIIDVKVLETRATNRNKAALLSMISGNKGEQKPDEEDQEHKHTATVRMGMVATRALAVIRKERLVERAQVARKRESELWRQNRPQSGKMSRNVDFQTSYISNNNRRQIDAIHASYKNILNLDAVRSALYDSDEDEDEDENRLSLTQRTKR